MKPHLDISHSGNLGETDRIRMSFDENSMTYLMSIMTDLYSDPELAVIREYSINGTDSHSRAGCLKPIEVTLPNDLDPVFIVKDYGVGLSAREIYENFSKYGWSSKRDDDTEAGMLGLGCKSALTYTSQFTLVANKDCIQNVVLITRDTDGAGAVQIVHTDETGEPDGVEVRIPVKDVAKFRSRAQWFYRFWEPGQVLVDGAEPFYYKSAANLELDPDIIITDQVDFDYIVMGNVPYPVPVDTRLIPTGGRNRVRGITPGQFSTAASTAAFFTVTTATTSWQKTPANSTYSQNTSSYTSTYKAARYGYKAIVRVPIGAVDFTPSREALQLNKRTMEVVQTAKLYIQQSFHRVAQTEINQAPSYKEALKTARRWDDVWKSDTYFYRGEVVPENFYPPENTWRWNSGFKECEKIGGYINDAQVFDALHVVNHFPKAVHARTKERVKKWLADNNCACKWVIFYDKSWGGGWFDEVQKVDYAVIKAVDISVARAPSIRTKCRMLVGSGDSIPVDAIPAHAVWMGASEQRTDRKGLYTFLHGMDKTISLILVAKDYEQKFRSENPSVPHISDWLKEIAQNWINGLSSLEAIEVFKRQETTDLTRLVSGMNHHGGALFDPELNALIAEVNTKRGYGLRDTIEKFREWLPKFAVKLDGTDLYLPPGLDGHLARIKAIVAKYPLIDWLPYSYRGITEKKHWDAFVAYANQTYLLHNGIPHLLTRQEGS